ncbi:hypothetical protein BASA61_005710 [Batrachochytrium salamandrivorans]|nr:hypothetical protein BASA61_005710 [Batrachochytrium salamandrivorans]
MKVAVALIYATATAPMAMAWGMQAHEVIGMAATELLKPKAVLLMRRFIPGNTLAEVSSWADDVKATKQYAFTKDFHYIKTKDDPSRKCSFNDKRDCPDGKCLAGAIAEYTSVFQGFKKKPKREVEDAFKFLTHFIGDISQPLHVSGHDNGGHNTQVRYGDITTSLHFVLDHYIPEQRIKQGFKGSAYIYANHLVRRIKQETKRGTTDRWFGKYSVFDVNERGNSMAAMDWARDSNSVACSAIWAAYYLIHIRISRPVSTGRYT